MSSINDFKRTFNRTITTNVATTSWEIPTSAFPIYKMRQKGSQMFSHTYGRAREVQIYCVCSRAVAYTQLYKNVCSTLLKENSSR